MKTSTKKNSVAVLAAFSLLGTVGGIAAEIVGKDIDDNSVDRVAGSSLTSGGFMKALDAIKADALA